MEKTWFPPAAVSKYHTVYNIVDEKTFYLTTNHMTEGTEAVMTTLEILSVWKQVPNSPVDLNLKLVPLTTRFFIQLLTQVSRCAEPAALLCLTNTEQRWKYLLLTNRPVLTFLPAVLCPVHRAAGNVEPVCFCPLISAVTVLYYKEKTLLWVQHISAVALFTMMKSPIMLAQNHPGLTDLHSRGALQPF